MTNDSLHWHWFARNYRNIDVDDLRLFFLDDQSIFVHDGSRLPVTNRDNSVSQPDRESFLFYRWSN